MGVRLNYDDNLFYINAWLKQLRAGIQLEIDGEMFLHKIVEDILFIHDCLMKLNTMLIKNPHFIQRLEFLRMLVLSKKEYVRFIEDLRNSDKGFAPLLAPFLDQFEQCRAIHRMDIIEITEILEAESGIEKEESDIISMDEYRFLFKQDGDSDIV